MAAVKKGGSGQSYVKTNPPLPFNPAVVQFPTAPRSVTIPGGAPTASPDAAAALNAYLESQKYGNSGSFDNMVRSQPTTPEGMAQNLLNVYGENYVGQQLQSQQDAEQAAADAAASSSSSSSSSSGGSGYDISGQIQAIKDQYAQHLADLDRQHTQLLGSLDEYAKQAKTGIGAQRADYATQASGANASVATNYAQARNTNAANQAAAQAEMARFGLDPSQLAPSIAKGSSYLDQQGAAQQALGTRLQQVQDAGFGAQQATTENIRNAGQGQLENNYAQFKSKLDLQRMQDEAQAQQSYQSSLRSSASSASGAGSDGLTAYQRAQLQLEYAKLDQGSQDKAYSELPSGFDLSTLDPSSTAYQAAFRGTLKDAQDYISSNVDSKTISADEGQQALQQLAQNYGSARRTARTPAKQDLRAALLKTYKG